MKKIDKKKLKWKVLIYLILLLFCFYQVDTSLQNDTFYTIKLGETLLKKGLIFKDYFSIHNLPYYYPHWFFDILIYLIHYFFSWQGIYLLVVFVISIISYLFYNELNKETGLKFFPLFVCMWFICFFIGFVTARAQLFSYLFFFIEYLLLSKYTKTLNKKYLYFLPVLSFLISNIHSAVLPVFYIIFIPYIASYIINTLKLKFLNIEEEFNEKSNYLKYLLIFIFISYLTSWINPIGIHAHTYVFKTMLGNSTSYIKEHLPTTIEGNLPFFILIFIFIIASIMLKIKYKLSDLFFILGFILMGFISNRHTSFFLMIGMFIIAKYILNCLSDKKIDKYDNFFMLVINKFKYIIFLILIILCIFKLPLTEDKFINEEEYPIEACDYILENLDLEKIRFYNEYDYGSYMLYRGIPVFIDSRSDLYQKGFNNKIDIFDDYMNYNLYINKSLIDKYKLDYGLVSKQDNKVYNLFLEYYKVIYEDDYFVIFDFERVGSSDEKEIVS